MPLGPAGPVAGLEPPDAARRCGRARSGWLGVELEGGVECAAWVGGRRGRLGDGRGRRPVRVMRRGPVPRLGVPRPRARARVSAADRPRGSRRCVDLRLGPPLRQRWRSSPTESLGVCRAPGEISVDCDAAGWDAGLCHDADQAGRRGHAATGTDERGYHQRHDGTATTDETAMAERSRAEPGGGSASGPLPRHRGDQAGRRAVACSRLRRVAPGPRRAGPPSPRSRTRRPRSACRLEFALGGAGPRGRSDRDQLLRRTQPVARKPYDVLLVPSQPASVFVSPIARFHGVCRPFFRPGAGPSPWRGTV